MDVRLSLQTRDVVQIAVYLHRIRKEPNLNNKFLGRQFTDQCQGTISSMWIANVNIQTSQSEADKYP